MRRNLLRVEIPRSASNMNCGYMSSVVSWKELGQTEISEFGSKILG